MRTPTAYTYRRLWNELCSAGEHSFAFRTFQILFMGYGSGNGNGERLVQLLLILFIPMCLLFVAECTHQSQPEISNDFIWFLGWVIACIASAKMCIFRDFDAISIVERRRPNDGRFCCTTQAIEPFLAITLAVREREQQMSLCRKGNQSALHFALRPKMKTHRTKGHTSDD